MLDLINKTVIFFQYKVAINFEFALLPKMMNLR